MTFVFRCKRCHNYFIESNEFLNERIVHCVKSGSYKAITLCECGCKRLAGGAFVNNNLSTFGFDFDKNDPSLPVFKNVMLVECTDDDPNPYIHHYDIHTSRHIHLKLK